MTAVLEVAEAMYQAGKGAVGPKMPDSLDELRPETQKRYLLLADAAITHTGPASAPAPSPSARQLLDSLAEQLAWKLNHPQQFADGVRDVLGRYAEVVGPDGLSEEVKAAMAI